MGSAPLATPAGASRSTTSRGGTTLALPTVWIAFRPAASSSSPTIDVTSTSARPATAARASASTSSQDISSAGVSASLAVSRTA